MLKQEKVVNLIEGSYFEGVLLLDKVEFLKTKNKKDYASVDFSDDTGKINGKIWDIDINNFPFKQGEVVKVTADVGSYANKKQFNNACIEKLPENSVYNKYLFMKKAPIEKEVMKDYFNEMFEKILKETPKYGNIIKEILGKDKKELRGNNFFEQPAAKAVHHNYIGGLSYHTFRMLKHAEILTNVYKDLNKNLLYTGVILHDIGKLVELTGIEATEYSERGILLGHISITDGWICEAAKKIGCDANRDEDIVLLRHLILSHHGKLEWGSPVSPKIPEAAVLHSIDKLDAELTQFDDIYLNTDKGKKTESVFGLGGEVYKPIGENKILD